jgi:DNA polymerase I-like protein with 3'-5' exonuclease and polymerase domains
MKKYSIRSMFIAPKGKLLISVDLSQAETWVVGYSAQDENMIYSLNYSDIHTDTASALFKPDLFCQHKWIKNPDESRTCTICGDIVSKTGRYIGKRFNHATSYRMKPPRAAQVINKDSDKPPYVTISGSEAVIYQERWHRRYPKVKGKWWPEIEYQLNKDRVITTVYGRKRTFFSQWGDELFKEATAFIPQSTVADHFNGAICPSLGIEGGLIQIYRELIKPYKDRCIINQSHDSCIVEVPATDAREVGFDLQRYIKRPLVINNVEFTIPVDGEIGERWGELEALR